MGFNDNKFTKGMNDSRKEMANTAKSAGGMSTTAKVSVAAMGVALIAATKQVISLGAEFSAQMSVVQAISGAVGSDMELLTAKAKQMGADTQFSYTEAGEALEYMAMAGWKTHDMLDGIEGIMYAAGASGESLARTADIVTDGLTAFGLEAGEATRFADVLAQASANSNTNIGMMGETFKYVAPIAGSLGYSIEDTALSIGLLANAGIKGGQAGTMLRSILSNLIAPTDSAATSMEELGISLVNADGTMKPFKQALEEIRAGFSDLTEEQKAQAAASIGGQRGMTGLLTIVNAAEEDFQSLARSIDDSTGVAKQMNEVRLDNLAGDVEIFKSGLEDLGLTIYDNFDKPLRDVVQAGTKGIDDLNAEFQRPEIRNAITEVGGLLTTVAKNLSRTATVIIPPLVTAVGNLASVFSAVSPILVSVVAGMAAMEVVGKVTTLVNGMRQAYDIARVQLALYMQTQKLSTIATAADATALGIKEVIVAVLTGNMTLATAAQWAWNAAITANPIGAVIAVIAAGIGTIIALVKWITKATDEEKKLQAEIDKTADASDNLTRSINENADAHEDNLKQIESSIGVTNNLKDKVYELAEAENKSASDKRLLAAYVDMLNDSMEGLNLAYDAEKDQLNMTKLALEGVIESRKASIKAQAEQQRAIEIAKEQVDIELQLEEIAKRKAEALEQYGEGTRGYNKAVSELVASETELNEQLVTVEGNLDAVTENMIKTSETAVTSNMAMEESYVNMFGQIFYDQEKFFDNQEEILTSFDEQVAAVNNMFGVISSESDDTTAGYISNLETNISESNKFYDNLQKLTELGLDEALVQEFRTKGIESATEVAVLADSTAEEVERLNALLVEATETGTANIKATWENAELEEAMNSPYAKALEASREQIAEFVLAAEDMAEGIVLGFGNKEDEIAEAGADLSRYAEKALRDESRTHSPSELYTEIGEDMGGGVALGLENSIPEVKKQATNMYDGILDESKQGIKGVQDEITKELSTTPDKVYTAMQPSIEKVSVWGGEMRNTARTQVSELNKTILTELKRLPDLVKSELDAVTRKAETWYTELKTGATTNIPEYVKQAETEFAKLAEPMPDIGVSVIDGLWSGMESRLSWLLSNIREMNRDLVREMNKGLDINSPSGVTEEMGEFTVEGFIVGLKSLAGKLKDTALDVFGIDDILTASTTSFDRLATAIPTDRGQGGTVVNQNIQTVPLTPYELAQASKAEFDRQRWQ